MQNMGVQKPEAEDVEELDKWMYKLKRKKRSNIFSNMTGNSTLKKNGGNEKTSTMDHAESTKLMLNMINSISAPKEDDNHAHNCLYNDEQHHSNLNTNNAENSVDSINKITETDEKNENANFGRKKVVDKFDIKHYDAAGNN